MNAPPPAPFDAWDAPCLCDQTARSPHPNGEPLRVVVIEDNRDAADSLRVVLEMLGNEVRVAYTGPEGVKAVTDWRPDAVISDIGLPGLDGYGAARKLRRDPAAARTLLIGLSGYGSEDDFALRPGGWVRPLPGQAGLDRVAATPPRERAQGVVTGTYILETRTQRRAGSVSDRRTPVAYAPGSPKS